MEKVETGRQLVEAGVTTGSCYFEWSAQEDADPGDPATWRSCMPALDHTIEESVVSSDFASMPLGEFNRAYLNRWTVQRNDPVIAVAAWESLSDRRSTAVDPVSFSFDVSPDRSRSAIGVAGKRDDGRWHVEVIEHGAGTSWVAERLAELNRQHRPGGVYCDASGPAGSLLSDLARLEVPVTAMSAREHAQAAGMFYDAAAEGTLRHLGQPEMAAAIDGAVKRPLGDAWAWSRNSSSVDISPLVACTLALYGAMSNSEPGGLVWSLTEVAEKMRREGRLPVASGPPLPPGPLFVPPEPIQPVNFF